MNSEQQPEKRVQFDFEVTFANGGGLRGEGFHLDIPGDDIADDALANDVIRDLRLLMVQSVQITNKQIITEPHKRSSSAGTEAMAVANVHHIDLSHIIEDSTTDDPSAAV